MVALKRRDSLVAGASRLAWSFLPTGNPPAARAYCCAIVGLVPGLGLLAGSLALVFGVWGWRVGCRLPRRMGLVHAKVSCLLGLCEVLSHTLAVLCFAAGARATAAG